MSPRRDDLDFILRHRLRKKKRVDRIRRRRRAGILVAIVIIVVAIVFLTVGFGTGAALTASCNLDALRPPEVHSNSFIYAADNTLLGSIPSSENREPVGLWRMSPWVPKASVAIEDRRFYKHGGVDYEGIARALWRDVSAGKVVEGGSTITQQLVRQLYVGRERTLQRKLKEACLAIKLSKRWSKQRILTEYLNSVYYGNHAYGIEAAAQTYFSRSAKRLTVLQAAMLAGLPQAPSDYDPFHRPQAALVRRDEVLRAMLANKAITLRQYQQGLRSQSLALKPGRIYTRIKEPYFFSYVRDELQREYGANTVRSGGLRVYTTIIPRYQRLAVKAIRNTLPYRSDPAAAIVTVEPSTGAIRAMTAVVPRNDKNLVKGRANQVNLAAQSARQAGSTFKTFVLASAIERGIDPDSTYYTSAPFTCYTGKWCEGDAKQGKPWHVETYDHTYLGSVSITRATLSSDNTVFAQLTLDVGPDYVWRMAKRLGVHLTEGPVPSLGLGSLDVTPLDMAAAYATFAAGGIYAKPMAITKVILPGGKVDKDAGWGKPQTKRAISRAVAWKVTDVLRQNALSGTGYGSSDGVHPNAGKTGTSENHGNAWFDGYTRDVSTVVWMGYLRGQKGIYEMDSVHGVSVAGATYCVPIWHQFMRAAEWRKPPLDFLLPDRYPAYRPFEHGHYGSLEYTQTYNSYDSSGGSYTPPAATTTTTTAAAPPPPPPAATTAVLQTTTAPPAPAPPPPRPATTQPPQPPPQPPPPPPQPPPPATTEPPPPPPPPTTTAEP
jgi:penicillin-binding protein 1A